LSDLRRRSATAYWKAQVSLIFAPPTKLAGQELATPIFDWASATRLLPRGISDQHQSPWDANRTPTLLFELFGLFLLRALR